MFMLPNSRLPQAETHAVADFAELLCLEKGQASAREIVAYLGRIDDNDHNVGCDDDDDENAELLDEAMNEIHGCAGACGTGYPFQLERSGATLKYDALLTTDRGSIYVYLLLSTRLNMRDNKVHAGIDGTHLLEELAAACLEELFGHHKGKDNCFRNCCWRKI